MAITKSKGSGQGGVRQYRTGRMVRCAQAPCARHARVIGGLAWTCEGCERGEAPYVPRRVAAGTKSRRP